MICDRVDRAEVEQWCIDEVTAVLIQEDREHEHRW